MSSNNFIKSLSLKNFLSYGEEATTVELKPLNIIIGVNGSGKSNFIQALRLLQNIPTNVSEIFKYDSVDDWLWKGSNQLSVAEIEALVEPITKKYIPLQYVLKFTARNRRFAIEDEIIRDLYSGNSIPKKTHFYYRHNEKEPFLVDNRQEVVKMLDKKSNASILQQNWDKALFPEISYLREQFQSMRIYQNWNFSSSQPPRLAENIVEDDEFLNENLSNLAAVLNKLEENPNVIDSIQRHLAEFYPYTRRISTPSSFNVRQLMLGEKNSNRAIPASRLSEGTLRYLCLLVILCHPSPPPVICLEEVDLGLHPNRMQALADLIVEASKRTQIILTTQSDMFLASFSEVFEKDEDDQTNLIVCERDEKGSQLHQQDKKRLQMLLEDDDLGSIWLRGALSPSGVNS